MFTLRPAGLDDLAAVLPRTAALNAHESITLEPAALEASLARLLGDPGLGRIWLIERAGAAIGEAGSRGVGPPTALPAGRGSSPVGSIGYAIATFGYDLEFGGRDAVLTELWIDPAERGQGAASAALALLDPELRALGVHALHLQVRPENPAFRLYQRSGFVASPRVVMTRRL